MRKEDLRQGIKVVNRKYGTEETILYTDLIMKDSVKGWIPAVVYTGPDRLSSEKEMKVFCKFEDNFLDEFDLI